MDPTPQMREAPSRGISNDISRRFVRLESLVEIIAMHVGLVELEDPATTPEDQLLLVNLPHPLEMKTKMLMKPHLQCLPGRKLAESSGNEPDSGKNNGIFFLPSRSSSKTFPVDDSISKYVSSCFYTYLKEDDFNKVRESDFPSRT